MFFNFCFTVRNIKISNVATSYITLITTPKRWLIQSHLQSLHNECNPLMGPFGDYELPMTFKNYTSKDVVIKTRLPNHCSVFDVSHMGVLELHHTKHNLKEMGAIIEQLFPLNMDILKTNKSSLSVVLNDNCHITDDFIISNIEDEKYRLIVNGATKKHFKETLDAKINEIDVTDVYTKMPDKIILAIQGDKSQLVLEKLLSIDLSDLYFMENRSIDNIEISRCGYTGEDGFELYLDKPDGITLYRELINLAKLDESIILAGLIERDILRLEAGLCLSGTEFSPNMNVHFNDANIDFVIGKKRRNDKSFIGGDNFDNTHKKYKKYKRVGFVCKRPIKKTKIYCYTSLSNTQEEHEHEIGYITSCSVSYNLGTFIAMGYIDIQFKNILDDDIYFKYNNKKIVINKIDTPFVKPNYYRNKLLS
jgi:aminomethyltransferase